MFPNIVSVVASCGMEGRCGYGPYYYRSVREGNFLQLGATAFGRLEPILWPSWTHHRHVCRLPGREHLGRFHQWMALRLFSGFAACPMVQVYPILILVGSAPLGAAVGAFGG